MPSTKGRILVVDDESIVRQSIEIVLSQHGYAVVEAESASDAWAKHAESPCDLVLVDKNLPGASGLELVRRLRAAADLVPAVVMTGFGSVESAIEGLHLGIGAYIEKPFEDIFAIAGVVDQVLRRQRELGGGASRAVSHFRAARAALHGSPSSAAVAASREGTTGLRLVLVVPSATERDGLAQLATTAADRVVGCASTREALAALQAAPADLVVVDAGVSAPDVFAFLESLRDGADAPACAILAGTPTLDLVRRLIGLGVRAVLEKPVDEQQVRERLVPVLVQLRHAAGTTEEE